MNGRDWLWPAAAAVPALAYLTTMPRQPYRGAWLLKSVPILILAGWALSHGDVLLGGALLASAGGDVALALDRRRFFLQGLSFFFVAHVLYCLRFLPGFNVTAAWWVLLLLVLATLALAVRLMWPGLGRLRLAVLAYIGAIALMVLAAGGQGSFLLAAGALLFMASDALIGLDKFWRPLPHAHTWIMILYYAGQFGLTTGAV